MIPAMPRANVYLPDDLAERLRPFADRINVSAVLQDALRKEIEIMSNATDERLSRLQESRARLEKDAYDQGRADGTKWALDDAEWSDLLGLSKVCPDGEVPPTGWVSLDCDIWDSSIQADRSRLDLESPWDRGFIEGALLVMGEVEEREARD